MKWIKRLLLLAMFVVVFAGVLTFSAWWLSRGAPDWYGRKRVSSQELAAAARRAEQQVQRTLNWASEQARPQNATTTQPIDSFQISLTEDELNGFFQKWDTTFGWSERYGSFLSDPQLAIEDGHVIVAATVVDMNSVLSVELQPRLDAGKLKITMERVLAGRLPLPAGFWEPYRRRVEAAVARRLPRLQHEAAMSADGMANSDAVAAAMSQLLLDVLDQRPAAPVLFLPNIRNGKKCLPVKVTDVGVADKTLTLTVRAMSPSEREAMLRQIRAPRSARAASGVESGDSEP